MRKTIALFVTVIGFVTVMSSVVRAADSASLTITTEVTAVNEISLADSSINMVIDRVVAGMQPAPVIRGTFYNVTSNESGKKLTVVWGSDWIASPGISFSVIPGDDVLGGTGNGLTATFNNVDKTDVAQDLCTASSVAGVYIDQQVTLKFSATMSSGLSFPWTDTLTFTIL